MDNPFSPPAADLHAAPPLTAGALIPDGRLLAAGHGWHWVRESLMMTASAPLQWFMITALFMAMGVTISLLPLVSLAWNVAVPIALGGVMMGCQALAQGRPLEIGHLFAAARKPYVQPLAMVGVLYLAATIIVVMTMVAVAGLFAVGAIALVGAEQVQAQPLLMGAGIAVLVLLVVLVTVALSMTLWFSPALVALNNVQPLEAMRMSLRGCMRNMLPFLIYGLVVLGVLLVAALAGGGFALAGGMLLSGGRFGIPEAALGALIVAVLCGLALAPTFWCAMYASYRDVFVA